MTPEDISVIIETQLKIAPATIPLDIMGTINFVNVVNLEAPRLVAASSIDSGICIIAAVVERLVNGSRRITRAMIMIHIVPLIAKGCLLTAIINAIPITPPGII